MPSPRQIAEQKNIAANFDRTVESSYDPEAGVPKGVSPTDRQPDYSTNVTNPAEPPAPAKNLKR